jgi:hypothetical protein
LPYRFTGKFGKVHIKLEPQDAATASLLKQKEQEAKNAAQ